MGNRNIDQLRYVLSYMQILKLRCHNDWGNAFQTIYQLPHNNNMLKT